MLASLSACCCALSKVLSQFQPHYYVFRLSFLVGASALFAGIPFRKKPLAHFVHFFVGGPPGSYVTPSLPTLPTAAHIHSVLGHTVAVRCQKRAEQRLSRAAAAPRLAVHQTTINAFKIGS
jgi:hypothetical protein